jgi:hypothetical protein
MKNVDYMKLIYDFHKEMLSNKFTLVYEGEITHQITKAFTSLAENKMDSYSEDASMKKKVFHVMVECLQNLSKHAEEFDMGGQPGAGNGIFIVGRVGDDNQDYHVMTGNAVESAKVSDLKALLEKINHLDKEGLKELFKKQMREGSLSEKGGAGLGLIDIARKTGEQLEYHFVEIDDKTSFFLLRTKISRNR